MTERLTLLPGTLELLVLQTLARGVELHGFEILDSIRGATEQELVIEEGSLYPALHRMERRGWTASAWGVSEKGRRAKYYRLTANGRRALAQASDEWKRYILAVAKVAAQGGAS